MGIRCVNSDITNNIFEDRVAAPSTKMCYPGIKTCITITGVLPRRLIGSHLTFTTTKEDYDKFFQLMKGLGGSGCQNFYVIGNITAFKIANKTKRKKISNMIKLGLNKNATVRFYDTSSYGDVNVQVENTGGIPNFFWIKDDGTKAEGQKWTVFDNRTAINLNEFQIR